MASKCTIANCGNELSPNARSNTCQACRRVFYYWQRPERGLTAILARQHNLLKWQARMVHLGGSKREYAALKRVIDDSGVNSGARAVSRAQRRMDSGSTRKAQ